MFEYIPLVPVKVRQPYWGLGRYARRRLADGAMCPPLVPRYWRVRRVDNVWRWIIMPAWLYWLTAPWQYRWVVHEIALRLGFLVEPYEGSYFHECRWTWKPWEGLDARRALAFRAWTFPQPPLTRWERFAYWLDRQYARFMFDTSERWV